MMISPITPRSLGVVIAFLLGTCWTSSSWVLPRCSQHPKTRHVRPVVVHLKANIFNQDEPDCPEEEECEIDWSAMPGFEDNTDDETKKDQSSEKEAAPSSVYEDRHLFGDEQDELEPHENYVRKMERSVEKSRMLFEMNWQIENCEVDEETCTDFCDDCAGSGKSRCGFCRGTNVVAFFSEFRPCNVCVDGKVDCSSCAGTGNISKWAKTHDKLV